MRRDTSLTAARCHGAAYDGALPADFFPSGTIHRRPLALHATGFAGGTPVLPLGARKLAYFLTPTRPHRPTG
ncbi:hypothetical protein GCM10009710_33860 [Aeromicrobium alkaliterrae]|uniref:Uncharacterized protein n=1 Tax=Aeromicrobium alkaliterrae TaxID=302168 RepID=A0ABP4WCM5_9ACTN